MKFIFSALGTNNHNLAKPTATNGRTFGSSRIGGSQLGTKEIAEELVLLRKVKGVTENQAGKKFMGSLHINAYKF